MVHSWMWKCMAPTCSRYDSFGLSFVACGKEIVPRFPPTVAQIKPTPTPPGHVTRSYVIQTPDIKSIVSGGWHDFSQIAQNCLEIWCRSRVVVRPAHYFDKYPVFRLRQCSLALGTTDGCLLPHFRLVDSPNVTAVVCSCIIQHAL